MDKIGVIWVQELFSLKKQKNKKTFVKWDGEIIPSSDLSLTTKEGPYIYEEILTILSTTEWTEPKLEQIL